MSIKSTYLVSVLIVLRHRELRREREDGVAIMASQEGNGNHSKINDCGLIDASRSHNEWSETAGGNSTQMDNGQDEWARNELEPKRDQCLRLELVWSPFGLTPSYDKKA